MDLLGYLRDVSFDHDLFLLMRYDLGKWRQINLKLFLLIELYNVILLRLKDVKKQLKLPEWNLHLL